MRKLSQKGIAHIGLLLLILVIAVIVFVGYRLAQNNKKSEPSVSTGTVAQDTTQVPLINTKADLNRAETVLNNENIDGDLNPDNYNQDVSGLQ